jgi:hypothetical protein
MGEHHGVGGEIDQSHECRPRDDIPQPDHLRLRFEPYASMAGFDRDEFAEGGPGSRWESIIEEGRKRP